jgi:CRISPR-associated protein (TIGR02710 family)
MKNSILVCTVGGSHQPILKALAMSKPDFVCFICTGRDPETGKPGSETQITGKGNIIAEKIGASPTLPNIPTLAGLGVDAFEVCRVPADDLDAAFLAIRSAMADLQRRFPGVRLVADYTGGTKSMTAALITAALEFESIELQLVTGARADLEQVTDTTEYAVSPNIDNIRLDRMMRPFLDAWGRYAYDEAAAGLSRIAPPFNERLRARLNLARSLSQAFASWDRFDHTSAYKLMDTYRPRIGQTLGLHLKALEMLNETGNERCEPLQLYDLWLNAERRAAQGRYDDAVARVYRLLEWTAQWQLRRHAGIDTAAVPADRIPPGMVLTKNPQGQHQAGLFQAWTLLSHLIPGIPTTKFFACHGNELLNHLRIRNESILAHGYAPIGRAQWDSLQDWIRQRFLPVLKECVKTDGNIRFDLDRLQLPVRLSEAVAD